MLARVLNTNPDKRYDVDDIMVHPWFTQVKHKPMPEETNFTNPKILPEVLDRVVGYGFDKEYTVRCLQANKHNHVTTTYFLSLKSHFTHGDLMQSSTI